ncbi:MAG: TetR/AcrR family transcriptional regulator, partial [Thermoguttaceae bacterium]
MVINVDHDQRRLTILEHAFSLFAESGYDGVTYQKIADRCGISRTTIYKYFHSKEQIFNYAIKLATGKINAMVEKVLFRKDWSAKEKLVRVLHITSKMLAENRIFLLVILEYLLSQKSVGNDVRRKVRRHTFGLKYLFQKLLA